jgi:hypothetical protein
MEEGKSSLKVIVWCTLMRNEVLGPFLFGEHTVRGQTFLAVTENTALRDFPVGTLSQSK